ncbi:MAG: acetyl-CoA decarbonylase/synthase complex subunit delta [Proteobacteria bacterium]|nr:acetyl-CoA decarbonylase/synthase complex subunit delta [Pseudomonadota bacterium]
MALAIPKLKYTGKIQEVTIGKGERAITLGGETAFPFYLFEGEIPHPPRIAMEVHDSPPPDWPDAATEPFRDVLNDPAAWAKKCVSEYGADAIALRLTSTDPNGANRPAGEVIPLVKAVAAAVPVPVLVLGVGNPEKDTEVLKKVAEECTGQNLVLGPVEEKTYKQIGASAIGFAHRVLATTPIDVNLAKQLNILLSNLGVPENQTLMDPTTGGLGYGLEYSYSVMERDRMAALIQEDEKLKFPLVNYVGIETWKTKEAKTPDDPRLGKARNRGILMEAITAVCFLLAGSDLVILRHPDSVKLVREIISELLAR